MALTASLVAHLGSRQVARTVYGSIIGLALVLTLEAHAADGPTVIGSLLASAVAVALAELYSEIIGARARASVGASAEPVGEVVADVGAVVFGIVFPSVFFLLAVLGVVSEPAAFELAVWSGLGLIAGYGYLAARISGRGRARAFLEAGAVGAIAAVLIALKALVH